jgi:prophage regulatory protein
VVIPVSVQYRLPFRRAARLRPQLSPKEIAMPKQIKTALEFKNALQILRIKQLEEVTGYKRSTIYKRIAEGTMPPPISLGGRSVGWRWSAVQAWLLDPAGYKAEV